MNIKVKNDSSKLKKLNESQQLEIKQQINHNDLNTQQLQQVFEVKTNQFKFSNGIVVANVNSGINNPFSLGYWANKATSIDNFIELVEKAMGFELSSSDISKLKTEYNKVA